jgi:hypothetical protein
MTTIVSQRSVIVPGSHRNKLTPTPVTLSVESSTGVAESPKIDKKRKSMKGYTEAEVADNDKTDLPELKKPRCEEAEDVEPPAERGQDDGMCGLCKQQGFALDGPSNSNVYNGSLCCPHMFCTPCHMRLKRNGVTNCPACAFDMSSWQRSHLHHTDLFNGMNGYNTDEEGYVDLEWQERLRAIRDHVDGASAVQWPTLTLPKPTIVHRGPALHNYALSDPRLPCGPNNRECLMHALAETLAPWLLQEIHPILVAQPKDDVIPGWQFDFSDEHMRIIDTWFSGGPKRWASPDVVQFTVCDFDMEDVGVEGTLEFIWFCPNDRCDNFSCMETVRFILYETHDGSMRVEQNNDP